MTQDARAALFSTIRESRKPSGPSRGDGSLSVDDADAFPLLLSLLGDLPKGATKGAKNGRVAFFLKDGKLTACVTCPSLMAVAFYTADGFADAFSRLEGALAQGKLEWREDKPQGRK